MLRSLNCQETVPGAAESPVARREQVGLIGLGLMGSAMAERILASGLSVLGFDIDNGRRAALAELGGRAAANPAELAQSCRRIILSLPNSEVVQTVLEQIEDSPCPGQVIIDTTTGCPEAAAEAGQRLAGRGITYVEAMISGNSSQVRKGTVLVIGSGPREAFAECHNLFACFTRRVFYIGDWGSGSRMKLVSNLVLGLSRATLAEGLTLAGKLGLNLEQTLGVLRESIDFTVIMDTKGRKMIDHDFQPQARLSQHLKDVRLMLAAAARSGARLPLSQVHERLLQQAETAGWGALDNSAIIQVFEQNA